MTIKDIVNLELNISALDTYPIFDENYRETFNNKFINHFYFHEIGFETFEIFNNRLYAKLCDIMPYFNQFYEIEKEKNKIGFENLLNKRYAETGKSISDNKQTSDTDNVNSHLGIDNINTVGESKRIPNLSTITTTIYGKIDTGKNEGKTFYRELGGKNISESANLNANTPQNNSPISSTSGDFDSFNNDVFKINGYLTHADKNLTINESHAENENENNLTSTNTQSGQDKTTILQAGEELTEYSSDVGNNYNSQNVLDGFVTTKTDNLENYDKYGNADYIKSLNDLRESIINIDTMIFRELMELFLEVY